MPYITVFPTKDLLITLSNPGDLKECFFGLCRFLRTFSTALVVTDIKHVGYCQNRCVLAGDKGQDPLSQNFRLEFSKISLSNGTVISTRSRSMPARAKFSAKIQNGRYAIVLVCFRV